MHKAGVSRHSSWLRRPTTLQIGTQNATSTRLYHQPTENGCTNNENALYWLQPFEKHTAHRKNGIHRMLVTDGHSSHLSAGFDRFYKENNIISVSMSSHSSHLLQPLDMGCFGPLKRAYSQHIEQLVKSHINHVTKVDFLIAFKAAFFASMGEAHIK